MAFLANKRESTYDNDNFDDVFNMKFDMENTFMTSIVGQIADVINQRAHELKLHVDNVQPNIAFDFQHLQSAFEFIRQNLITIDNFRVSGNSFSLELLSYNSNNTSKGIALKVDKKSDFYASLMGESEQNEKFLLSM